MLSSESPSCAKVSEQKNCSLPSSLACSGYSGQLAPIYRGKKEGYPLYTEKRRLADTVATAGKERKNE